MRFFADELETLDRQTNGRRSNPRRFLEATLYTNYDDVSDTDSGTRRNRADLQRPKRYTPLTQQRRPYEAP